MGSDSVVFLAMTAWSGSEILVVGAGPTGLTLACELRRREIACRVIDAAEGPSGFSKAIAIWPRTLELLDDMSVADRFLARGRPLHAVSYRSDGRRIGRIETHRLIETPFPFALSIPQSETERVLVERLADLGGGVEWGTRLRQLSHDAERVRVTLEHGAAVEHQELAYAVGCDGAHSAVRSEMGVGFVGARYEESFLLADLPVETSLSPDEAHFFLSPAGVLGIIPLPGDLWRVIVDLRHSEPDTECEPAPLQSVVDTRGPGGIRLGAPRWSSTFRIHRRMAEALCRGRCFLAGDAAHIHSPAGGQGMNAGMQDGYNLAWKLALVVKGVSGPQLLSSYAAERQPIVRQVIRGTDAMTRLGLLRSPGARRLRDFAVAGLDQAGLLRRYAAPLMAGLTQKYRRSPIVSERVGPAGLPRPGWCSLRAGPHAGERAPDAPLLEQHTLSAIRLFHVLRDPRHSLLIFGEEMSTNAVQNELQELLVSISGRYGKHLAVHLLATGLTELPDINVLVDHERLAHSRYRASQGCLYLIRPDGYIGYRTRAPDPTTLLAHLETVFGSLGPPAPEGGVRPPDSKAGAVG